MVPLLLLLYAAGVSQPAELHGTVLDPQSLPVGSARVELTCSGATSVTSTNDSGSFTFQPHAPEDVCFVSVTHEGFAPFRQRIRADAGDGLVLRLRIAA